MKVLDERYEKLAEGIKALSPMRGQDLLYQLPPDVSQVKPLTVVSQAMVEYALGAAERSSQLEVATAEDFHAAAAFLNEMGKIRSSITKKALDLGKPFRDVSNQLTGQGRQVTDVLESACVRINDQMVAFRRRESEARALQMKEQEEAARQRAALEAEARAREEAAVKAIDGAKDEAEFTRAGDALQDAVAVHDLAAETAAREREALAKVQAAPTKASGVRSTKVAVILSADLKALPLTYHMVDEAKIKRHILDGTVTAETPGVKFRVDDRFSGTGR